MTSLAPEQNAFLVHRCRYCGQPKHPDYNPTHPECAAPLAAIREQDRAGLQYHINRASDQTKHGRLVGSISSTFGDPDMIYRYEKTEEKPQ